MRISDWSSDVCSSDLMMRRADEGAGDERGRGLGHRRRAIAAARLVAKPRSAIRRSRAAIGGENVRKLAKVPRSVIRPGGRQGCPAYRWEVIFPNVSKRLHSSNEIGRASCGERVCQYV